jgi:hypothetical protein
MIALRASTLALAGLLLLAPITAAQSELVLRKEGSKEYHRPGCEVVRDTTGVVALTRGQAEAQGLKAHAACDPANPAAPAAQAKPQFVFVDSGRYYHRETCKKLERDAKKVALDEAGKKYWPCPECKPPIRKPAAGRPPK